MAEATMSDMRQKPGTEGIKAAASPFSGPPQDAPRRGLLLGAGLAIVLIAALAGALVLRGGRQPAAPALNVALPLDSYAANLSFTQLAMSESTSLSGGKSTYIDGHVRNSGPQTLAGVTMQVLFGNDQAMPPQVETLPLSLVRTHEPYVDTEPVSAAPLKPGDEVEFRLIFETIPSNWNQQLPEMRVVHIIKR